MDRLHIKRFYSHYFSLLLLLFILRVPVFATVFSVTDFTTYEFVKKNFTYSETGKLVNLADNPIAPVASISFRTPKKLSAFESYAFTWDQGVSGIAPRFFGNDSGLSLPGWKEFFSTKNFKGFTLSFYFFPETIGKEEILFEVKPNLSLQQNNLSPHFKIALQDGHLGWELNEFFFLGKDSFSKKLKSLLPIRLGEWNHGVIGYDERNNRLVMYLNGELVDFKYATPDGLKHSSRYQMGFVENSDTKIISIHKTPEMILGKNFTGRIDEIELYNVFLANLPTRYRLGRGEISSVSGSTVEKFIDSGDSYNQPPPYRSVFASKVFRLGKHLRLTEATITGSITDAKLVKLYLCSSKNYFEEQTSFASCNPIILNRQIIDYPSAEFHQFFLVYDQLEHASKTLDEMSLTFTEDDVLLPPRWVNVSQIKEGVMLEWKETLENIAGYRVYYSLGNLNTDRQMLEISVEELEIYKTPDTVWTYVLEGLETDRAYNFIVTSFDYRDGKVRESAPSPIQNFFYSSEFFN